MENLYKLAAEKGYNTDHIGDTILQHQLYVDLCLLQKWLRDKHKLFIEIYMTNVLIPVVTEVYSYLILSHEAANGSVILHKAKSKGSHSTYEEALEKAIIEALKLLP